MHLGKHELEELQITIEEEKANTRKLQNPGNIAFLAVISSFVLIAVLGIAFLGFTNVSLALLILCVVLGTMFGIIAESVFGNSKPLEQDVGTWPDDVNDDA